MPISGERQVVVLASDLVQQLIDSGIHFGHKASRWNPKMKPFILGKRNTVHLIDLKETIRGLIRAKKFLSHIVSQGQDVLFVGTKRQARLIIQTHSERVMMPFVIERWLGGTLTNFRTIRSRLGRLEYLELEDSSGRLAQESKKTISRLTRERKKILRNLHGIRKMSKLPGVVVVIDVTVETNAILEAQRLGIPTIALIDTDADPELIDIPIPGNDDSIRAIEIVMTHLADAVEMGKRGRSTAEEQPAAETTGGSQQPKRRTRRPTITQLADAGVPQYAETADSSPPTGAAPVAVLAEPAVGAKATSGPQG